MTTLTKLLIANRGEIACRIARTCKALDIPVVAVHSEADQGALHVEMADEAYPIGPAPAKTSYLNVDALIAVAKQNGANAVHPGYGFLAESPDFARRVVSEGLIWVGPKPETIADMGDKERARDIAVASGVPVLPGSARFQPGDLQGLDAAADAAGYPLLAKAACGGGGIGMRRVDAVDALQDTVAATQSMAQRAFGDGSIYLERFVPNARHIEVQVCGFGDGTGVHLYDRDCSLQRRFQKIVEEAIAPDVAIDVRQTMEAAALSLVRHERYSGAGTVEFIYDMDRREAYFLEMNTRTQVEHPVTEMITGIALIRWQIEQAAETLLALDQSAVRPEGHAVEARIYAERPEKGFLPAPGLLETIEWPEQNGSLRIDKGIRAGDRITPHYDPMIAKLVALGNDREMALDTLSAALAETQIIGTSTNLRFLRDVVASEAFRAGGVSTAFLPDWHRVWASDAAISLG